MSTLGMNVLDILIVREYLDEIDAISRKYESNREEVIAFAENINEITVSADCISMKMEN